MRSSPDSLGVQPIESPGIKPVASAVEAGDAPVAVPDAAFFVSSEFIRSASDLKIVAADGREFLITNYFASDTLPALVAPNGTALNGDTVSLLAGPQFPAQYAQAGPGSRPEPIGEVSQAEGTVTVQHANGQTGDLKAGDPVFQGDVVQTGENSLAGITFIDGTALQLQASSRMVLNELVYEPEGASNSAVLNALEGTFSLVAGQIAPTGDMQIVTPIATMGIRGTSVLGIEVQTLLGYLSTIPDPGDGEVHPIPVYKDGVLVGVLTSAFKKITIGPDGLLVESDLSPEELLQNQEFTQALHDFYEQYGPPQANQGPQQQNQDGTNSYEDIPGFQKIDGDTGEGTPDGQTPLPDDEGNEEGGTLIFIPFPPEFTGEGPAAGDVVLPSVQEANIDVGEDGAAIFSILPFVFGDAGPGAVDFASLHGTPVTDADGNTVESKGVPLEFRWDGNTNTLTAFAGSEAVIEIALDPDTGAFVLTLLKAIDHLGANGQPLDSLSISLAYTVTNASNQTAEGVLTARFGDDAPVAQDDEALQIAEGDAGGVAGNVLDNDDPGADGASLTHVNLGDGQGWREIASGDETAQESGVFRFVTAAGTYTFAANGDWTFVPADDLDNAAQPVAASFDYRLTDVDGDFAEATQPLSVTDGAGPQAAGAIALLVDEAALDEQLDGDDLEPGAATGTDPQSAQESDQGTGLAFTAGTDSINVAFADPESPGWSDPEVTGLAEGFAITWSLEDGQLVGTLVNNGAVVGPVIYLALSGETAAQPGETAAPTLTATLAGPLPHAAGEGDITIEDIPVVATDTDGTAATGFAGITVEDDAPLAANDIAEVGQGQQTKSDVVLIIDESGSMDDLFPTVKTAVQNLFNSGLVNSVFLVSFASGATFHDSDENDGWYTNLNNAFGVVNGLNAGGGTNYDAALAAVVDNFENPPPGGDKLVSMFLSDGLPGNGIDQGEETVWINFLTANGFDESFAFGFGGLGPDDIASLEPIAWSGPGETADDPYDADNVSANDDPNVIIVEDPGDLAAELTGAIAGPVSGNVLHGTNGVLGNNDDDIPGADGPGGIVSVTVDGTEFTFDGQNIGFTGEEGYNHIQGSTLQVQTLLGGDLTFHFDDNGENLAGDWTYVPPEGSVGNLALPYENFRYTITDSEGDASTASLTVILNPDAVDNVFQGDSNDNRLVNQESGETDVFVGGLGGDTFVLNDDTIADFIADYSFQEGDEVDLTQLVDLNGGDIGEFVRLQESGDGAVDELQVDTSGSVEFTTVVRLDGDAGVKVVVDGVRVTVDDNSIQVNDIA